MDVPVEDVRRLEYIAFDAYIDGLMDVGWRGDPGPIHDAYVDSVGLRYGVGGVRIILPVLLDPALSPLIEQALGHPFDEILANLAGLNEWLLSRVRARGSIRSPIAREASP